MHTDLPIRLASVLVGMRADVPGVCQIAHKSPLIFSTYAERADQQSYLASRQRGEVPAEAVIHYLLPEPLIHLAAQFNGEEKAK